MPDIGQSPAHNSARLARTARALAYTARRRAYTVLHRVQLSHRIYCFWSYLGGPVARAVFVSIRKMPGYNFDLAPLRHRYLSGSSKEHSCTTHRMDVILCFLVARYHVWNAAITVPPYLFRLARGLDTISVLSF